jgi:predicted RND superfamily exporter protein
MVVGVSLIGIYRMEVNNYLLEDLSEDDPVNQQYIFFEKHYDGVRPFEAQLNFDEENSVFTASKIMMLESLESALKEKFRINKMNSLVQVYKAMNRAINGGSIEEYRLPENQSDWKKSHHLVRRLWKSGKLSPLLSDDGQKIRITARADDLGGKYFNTGS